MIIIKHRQLSYKTALTEEENFISKIPVYRNGFKGRGIVICGGGITYFTNAWVTINILRHLGCNLPIQLWYLDNTEMDESMIKLMDPFNVECINGRAQLNKYPARTLNGWELKPYALLNCPYEEVLLLDADNVPAINPEFLFDLPEYKETGALFWPDRGRLNPEHSIWEICGIEYKDEPEFESGQMVINKEFCWPALCLCKWYNDHSDFFYHHIYGDKETFHMAFRKLNKAYTMNPFPVKSEEGIFFQHDFEGNILFQHRTRAKWSLSGINVHNEGFILEKECLDFLEDLEKKWTGRILPGRAIRRQPV